KYKFVLTFAVGTVVLLILSKHAIPFEQVFYGFPGYDMFRIENWRYLTIVTFHYGVAFLCTYFVLNVVNNEVSIITKWGRNSLAIFLFHPVFMYYLRVSPQWLENLNPDIRFVVLTSIAISVTLLLGSNWFNSLVKSIIYPYSTIQNVFRFKRNSPVNE